MSHHGRSGKNSIPAENAQGRGRTAQTHPDPVNPTKPNHQTELKSEANRPITPGGGKKRGDRQNTDPDPGMRHNRENRGLRTDRNPTSAAGRKANHSEGG
jgi:hypothetical protein